MSGIWLLVVTVVVGLATADYWEDRTRFLQAEGDMFVGADIQLNAKEKAVNQVLMAAKKMEYHEGFASPNTTFAPARHFFQAKKDIQKSEVFKFIQKMPKGALLHGHDMALASTEYLVKNLTYRDHLYMCEGANKVVTFHFFTTPDASCDWQLVSAQRAASGDVAAFDAWLGQKMTLVVPNPKERYPDINAVWAAFGDLFTTVFSLLTYRPVLEDYFYQVLTEFHDDNVMYLEFRALMQEVYELNGTYLTVLETAKLFNDVSKRFVIDHPRHLGARVIYAPSRRVNSAAVLQYLEVFRTLRTALPDFVAGFDLVGQEDKGSTLAELVQPILDFQKEGAQFFFHAGETNWQGETDLNIVDAILLNTTRIGHGYALTKHPLAMKLVKERGIAIEVNPISNQVLLLVSDLRNHPASTLLADNYPVVIAADDPSFWGAQGLSYDHYAAFMGLCGEQADLRALKQLAINSIRYSAMPVDEKAKAMSAWMSHWDMFLDNVLQHHTNMIITMLTTCCRYSAMPVDEKAKAMSAWMSDWDMFLDSVLQHHTNMIPPLSPVTHEATDLPAPDLGNHLPVNHRAVVGVVSV